MKKTLVSLSLIASTALFGANSAYNYEITPTVGGTHSEGNLDLEEYFNYGLRFGINMDSTIVDQIELGFEKSSDAELEDNLPGQNPQYDIERYFINAVKMYDTSIDALKFYGLAGIGYEDIDGGQFAEDPNNDDAGFFQYGLGFQYSIPECDYDLAIKTEVRHAIKFDHGENNMIYTIGLAIPLGKKPVAAPAPVVVPEPAPAPVAPPAPAPVLDGDNDGVIDANDKCPTTPPGVLVDADGCTIIHKIKVNFDSDKSAIKPEFQGEIDKATQIMNDYKGYNATISGHTDSTASDAYNQKLSERRAVAVKNAIVANGISDARLNTEGLGESQPVADNATKEGRYENRRIELTLQK
ncbi:MAG: OmpA family protein [Campylobacterota bacterium]|nr:OmpA family protein [Campylobacterota bacterium]